MKKKIYILLFLIIGNLNAESNMKLFWPSPPDEPKIEYLYSVRKIDDLGIKKGFFSKLYTFVLGEDEHVTRAPFGIYADKSRIYTTDIAAKSLFIFDREENNMITINGSDNETFLYPIDVVADSEGNIFVTDSVRAKVYVFEKNGNFNYEIKHESFRRPIGVAICPDESKLYIVDAVASRIHIITKKGKLLGHIGSYGSNDGEFNKPTFIDIDNNGKIYVSDSMNHRVQIFDKDGKFIRKFGQLGQQIGDFGSPRGLSVDSYGNIYVSDTMFNKIQIFNSVGELLMVFGGFGSEKGQFSLVEDISISSDNTIYIADTNNKRFQVFKLIESGKGEW